MTEDTYTGEANDPLSLNLYTYCHNEPVMYDDPTGHKANRVLDYGDKGDMVKAIQEKLLGLDYSLGGYKATGNYAGCTQSAVKEFQKDYGLPVTGVVDNRTMNVLCTAYSLRSDNDHQKVYNQIELVKKNSKSGDIPGEAILLSQGTYENTIKKITTTRNSTSDPKNTVVHTKVVNNKVQITGVEKKQTNQTKPNGTGNNSKPTTKGNDLTFGKRLENDDYTADSFYGKVSGPSLTYGSYHIGVNENGSDNKAKGLEVKLGSGEVGLVKITGDYEYAEWNLSCVKANADAKVGTYGLGFNAKASLAEIGTVLKIPIPYSHNKLVIGGSGDIGSIGGGIKVDEKGITFGFHFIIGYDIKVGVK